MGLRRGAPVPALVVPDDETWLAWGGVLEDSVLQPTVEPARARVLLLPERVPSGLAEAVKTAWTEMSPDRSAEFYDAPFPGLSTREVLEDDEETPSGVPAGGGSEHGGHEGHDDEDDGHGDMMAVTGAPSADGLVMETLDVEAGPLGVALPGGLVVSAELDGDVVASCEVRQTLWAGSENGPPDVWSAVAWNVAELAAEEARTGVAPRSGDRWFRVAAVELERAVGHLAWLHRFCRLLGWDEMTKRVRRVLSAFVSARGSLPVEVAASDLPGVAQTAVRERLLEAGSAAGGLGEELSSSRLFARRTAGLGRLSLDDAVRRQVTGPVARAAGVSADARGDDPAYRVLGFEAVVREEGDARARSLLRVEEVARSAVLAARAIECAEEGSGARVPPPAEVVESARGPVQSVPEASGHRRRTAPGAGAARSAAGELAVGREWAAALVTIASFDISPWRVES